MAELEEEEIIIIDDNDAVEDSMQSESLASAPKSSSKQIYVFIGIALILLIGIVVMLLSTSSEEKVEDSIDIEQLDDKLSQAPVHVVDQSKLDKMIAKADYLYSNNSQEKALTLYAKIAHYSEGVSLYNLGVAQLKNEQYDLALKTFAKAIQNDDKRCVSAINAAVCSLHLKDKKSFGYYIDLAASYLHYEVNSPLYSYYYALVHYYQQDYLAALNALKNSTSDAYPNIKKNLSAKINALYGNDYAAIDVMEKNLLELDDFSIGLLYARVGNFKLAVKHLEDAIVTNTQAVKAQLALGLINLKLGHMQKAATQIQNITDMFEDEVYTYYPIKLKLKESLFDTTKAQKRYRSAILNSKLIQYQKIFVFSPYKIFNANQTVSSIRKGNVNIFVKNTKSAKQYYKSSAQRSNVNMDISNAIKKALNHNLREANSDFKALVKIQPKHSILQYNLALTYAQMGYIKQAHEHFLRSYYLDSKNYLSGIYAIMTSQLLNKDFSRLRTAVSDSVNYEDQGADKELHKTLLYIVDNNYISAIDWLDRDLQNKPLYLTLDILIALKLEHFDMAQKATEKIVNILPNDILPHLMYIDAHFHKLKPKMYANKVLNYLKKQPFNYLDLYYGDNITSYLYTLQTLNIGKLYFLRQQLKEKLASTSHNTVEIENALALASLYDRHFEEAYVLYNHLIDERKIQDSYTLFLGALASTAAGHHANAIGLLELSKIKNGSAYESRYALALLYMEAKNNKGAAIQLSHIKQEDYRSMFYDFEIDTKQLLFKKNNQ